MEVQCNKCGTRLSIQFHGTYKCPSCGEIFIVSQQVVSPTEQTVLQAAQASSNANFTKLSFFKNKFREFKTWAILSVCAALIIAGSYFAYSLLKAPNALDYVPENAQFVVYGNTHALFDSKLWEVAEAHKDFRTDVLAKFKDTLNISNIKDLDGNFAVFGNISSESFNAVVVLKKDNAEKIYNDLKSELKRNYPEVKEKTIDGKSNITAYRQWSRYNYSSGREETEEKAEISVAVIDKNVLQLAFYREQNDIFKPEKTNKTAARIDKSAVFAVATSPDYFDEISDLIESELDGIKTPVDQLGTAVLEVFLTPDEVKIRARVDISELKK